MSCVITDLPDSEIRQGERADSEGTPISLSFSFHLPKKGKGGKTGTKDGHKIPFLNYNLRFVCFKPHKRIWGEGRRGKGRKGKLLYNPRVPGITPKRRAGGKKKKKGEKEFARNSPSREFSPVLSLCTNKKKKGRGRRNLCIFHLQQLLRRNSPRKEIGKGKRNQPDCHARTYPRAANDSHLGEEKGKKNGQGIRRSGSGPSNLQRGKGGSAGGSPIPLPYRRRIFRKGGEKGKKEGSIPRSPIP